VQTWGRVYWPIFLIISSAWLLSGFGVAETIALLSPVSGHLDNTLSTYARTELGVSVAVQNGVHTIAWWCSFVAWTLFVTFITAHIWFLQFG
jgi:hypothetical protein